MLRLDEETVLIHGHISSTSTSIFPRIIISTCRRPHSLLLQPRAFLTCKINTIHGKGNLDGALMWPLMAKVNNDNWKRGQRLLWIFRSSAYQIGSVLHVLWSKRKVMGVREESPLGSLVLIRFRLPLSWGKYHSSRVTYVWSVVWCRLQTDFTFKIQLMEELGGSDECGNDRLSKPTGYPINESINDKWILH